MCWSVPTGAPITVVPSVTILIPCWSALLRSCCVMMPLPSSNLHLSRHSSMPVRSLMMALYLTMLSSRRSPSPNRSTSSAKPIAPAVATSGWVSRTSLSMSMMACCSATAKKMVAIGSPCFSPVRTHPTNPCTEWKSFDGPP